MEKQQKQPLKATVKTESTEQQETTIHPRDQILGFLKRQNPNTWFSSADIQGMLQLDRKITNDMSKLYDNGNGKLERKKEARPLSTDPSRSKQMFVYRHKDASASIVAVRASVQVAPAPNPDILPPEPPPQLPSVSVDPQPKGDDELLQEMIASLQTKLQKEEDDILLQRGVQSAEEEQLNKTIKALEGLVKKRESIELRRNGLKKHQEKLEGLREKVQTLQQQVLGEKQQSEDEPPPEKLATKKTTRPQRTPPFYEHPPAAQ